MEHVGDVFLTGRRGVEHPPYSGKPIVYAPELLVDPGELLTHAPELLIHAPELLVDPPEPLVDPGELLIHAPELLIHPAEPLVNPLELLVDPGETGVHLLAERIERRGNGLPEVAKLASEFAHITVSRTSQHPRGGGILLTDPYASVQIADLCFQRRHTRFEALGLHTRKRNRCAHTVRAGNCVAVASPRSCRSLAVVGPAWRG